MSPIAPHDYKTDRDRLEKLLDTNENKTRLLGRMQGVNDFCFFILMHYGTNKWLADRLEEFEAAGYPEAPEYQEGKSL